MYSLVCSPGRDIPPDDKGEDSSQQFSIYPTRTKLIQDAILRCEGFNASGNRARSREIEFSNHSAITFHRQIALKSCFCGLAHRGAVSRETQMPEVMQESRLNVLVMRERIFRCASHVKCSAQLRRTLRRVAIGVLEKKMIQASV